MPQQVAGSRTPLPVRLGRGNPSILDALLVLALIVVAVLTRRHGLPTDGLWHDDAWVAAGAVKGSFSELLDVGSAHPGFTGGLMLLSRLTDADSRALAYPAFVAGALGPAALYLGLRLFGHARSISALLGAALVVADIHVLYSTRVRSYVIDTLIVLGLVVLVPRLARVTWGWRLASGWFVAALLIGSFSGFGLVAMAVAAGIFVLHPASDRRVRVIALAAQGVAAILLVLAERRTFDADGVELNQEIHYDGHLDFSANPLRFAGEAGEHMERVVTVFPGGPGWLVSVSAVAVAVGLLFAAFRRGPRSLVLGARYLGLILLLAFLGGVAHRFPFGTTGGVEFSRGERASLWLIPVVAFGLAFVLKQLRSVARPGLLRGGFDAIAFGTAALIVVLNYSNAPSYPLRGARSATAYIESNMGPDDRVLIALWSMYPYAVESERPVIMSQRKHEIIGFVPDFVDPHVHVQTPGTKAQTAHAMRGGKRVFFPVTLVFTPLYLKADDTRRVLLRQAGYQFERLVLFDSVLVEVWQRRGQV